MNCIPEEKIRECTHIFMSTDRQRRKCFDRMLKSVGIHHSQHMVLMFIARHDGTLNQKQIACKFDVSPAAVAGTIKKLENNGYITRLSFETDNRFNEVRITEKGQKIIDQTSSAFAALDQRSFKYFSEDEVDQLIMLLNKMKKSLSEEESV